MSIEIKQNLANDFRSGSAERKGEYRNLAKSSEMILGVWGVERKGEYRNLAKYSKRISGVGV